MLIKAQTGSEVTKITDNANGCSGATESVISGDLVGSDGMYFTI